MFCTLVTNEYSDALPLSIQTLQCQESLFDALGPRFLSTGDQLVLERVHWFPEELIVPVCHGVVIGRHHHIEEIHWLGGKDMADFSFSERIGHCASRRVLFDPHF